jgi:hypothetical protein
MQRSRFLRWAIMCLPGMILLALIAGCAHHTPSTAPVTVPPAAPIAATAPPAAFQPYTLLPPTPPAPPVATPRHRVLHLTRVHQQVYLADSDRHLYEAGRDTQGHIYPIYRDPATHVTYPLYYDSSRDNLYRLARNGSGHFYRNYVGQPTDNFYDTDRDYERITPSDEDRPIVTDSYNKYNYNTYDYGPSDHHRYANYSGYRPYNEDPDYGQNHPYYTGSAPPPPHHSSHFNYNWLWAIPVIVGAYLLLQPRHSTPQVYRPSPTVIVRGNRPVTIANTTINNTSIHNTTINNTVINQAIPVGYRPIASPRPVYVYPAGYTPHPGYAPAMGNRAPDVRPHRSLSPLVAAPLGALAVHAALTRPHPSLRPPVLVSRRAVITPRRIVAAAPSAVTLRHIVRSEQRHPLVLAPRPVIRPENRPLVRRITLPERPAHLTRAPRPRISVPEQPRLEPRHTSLPFAPRSQPERIQTAPPKPITRLHSVEPRHIITPRQVIEPRHLISRPPTAVHPQIIVRPQSVRHPSSVSRPQMPVAPHVERRMPPLRVTAPPHLAAARPHPVRVAPSSPKHDEAKSLPGKPKKEESVK